MAYTRANMAYAINSPHPPRRRSGPALRMRAQSPTWQPERTSSDSDSDVEDVKPLIKKFLIKYKTDAQKPIMVPFGELENPTTGEHHMSANRTLEKWPRAAKRPRSVSSRKRRKAYCPPGFESYSQWISGPFGGLLRSVLADHAHVNMGRKNFRPPPGTSGGVNIKEEADY